VEKNIRESHRLQKKVKDVRSKRVSQKGVKQEARGVVDDYLRNIRVALVLGGLAEQVLTELDVPQLSCRRSTQENSDMRKRASQLLLISEHDVRV
jgi:hypothetical protein